MPDAHSIRDLPDTSRIDQGKSYLVSGAWLVTIFEILKQLWRGENVGKGPNIRLRGNGLAGYTITGATQTSSGGAGSSPHAYTVSDASSGTSPMVSVIPGTHNGVVPTISGSPINVMIGSPLAYPLLTLGSGDTLVYFQIDYASDGSISSVEIMSGTSLPSASITPGSSGSDYKLLSTLTITYDLSGNAKVTPNNDALSGPQGYAQCGTISNVWLV